MTNLLPFLAILGFLLALAALKRSPLTGVNIFSVVSVIPCCLYLLALAGLLRMGALVMLVAGSLAGITALVVLARRDGLRASGRFVLTPPFVVFLILGMVFFAMTTPVSFREWDEFSHWGLVTKEICLTHRLPEAGSTPTVFQDYPLGANLFHYYFCRASAFAEGRVYWAHTLLLLAPIMVLGDAFHRRQWLYTAISTISAFTLVWFLGFGVLSVYVDVLVALIFAAIVLAVHQQKPSVSLLVQLLPALFFLPLVKKVGGLMAFFAVLVIGLEVILNRASGPEPVESRRATLRRRLVLGLALALIVATPWAATTSWKNHVAAQTLRQTHSRKHVSSAQVRQAFSPAATDRQKTVLSAFCKALTERPLSRLDLPGVVQAFLQKHNMQELPGVLSWSVRDWLGIVLFLLACTVILTLNSGVRRKDIWFILVQELTVLIYLALQMLLYTFIFSDYEARRLASFERYASIPILALALEAIHCLLVALHNRRSLGANLVACALPSLLLFATWGSAGFRNLRQSPQALTLRAQLQPLAARVASQVPPSGLVYIICQGSTGFEKHVLGYELCPRRVNSWGWALGEPRGPEDPWTTPHSQAQWLRILKNGGYDAVALIHTDTEFWERYGPLFPKGFDRSQDVIAVDRLGTAAPAEAP